MKTKKVEKLVANLHDKTDYVINRRNLKQALNNELVFKKVHEMIKVNQNASVKPYIHTNTNLKKYDFKKDLLMNNAVFGKKYGKREKTLKW